jgi:tetratricopeptide (TPR) repeat protein
LAASGAIAGVLAVELLLRAAGYGLLLEQERENRQSLREGTIRVLCLGESTTMDQYPRFLERALNAAGTRNRFAVIDKGVGGTNTGLILSKLPEWLELYRPHVVVTMMGINDGDWAVPLSDGASFLERVANRVWSWRTVKLVRLAFEKSRRLDESVGRAAAPPQDPVQRGDFEQSLGNPKEAERWYTKALEIDPADESALLRLGDLLFQDYRDSRREESGRRAESFFEAAAKLRPENPSLPVRFGDLYLRRFIHLKSPEWGRRAENYYRQALRGDAGDARVFIGMGELLQARGELDEAETWFRRAAELPSGRLEASRRLGEYFGNNFDYADRDKWKEAEKWYGRAFRMDPDDEIMGEMSRQFGLAYGAARAPADFEKNPLYRPITVKNYRRIRDEILSRGIAMVSVEYPMRPAWPLAAVVENRPGTFLVDNEKSFREAVAREGYEAIFSDRFGEVFGHCTEAGNELLADNIAAVILERAAVEER